MSAQHVRTMPHVDAVARDRPALDGGDGIHESASRFLMPFIIDLGMMFCSDGIMCMRIADEALPMQISGALPRTLVSPLLL